MGRWSIAGSVVIAHLVFRVLYYGDVVPNTFHAKVGGGFAALPRGVEHAGSFAIDALPLLLLASVAVVFALRRSGPNRSRTLLLVTLAVVYVAYVIYVGGDFKRTYRFLALPALLFAALAGVGAVRLADRLWSRPERYVLLVPLLAVGVLWAAGTAPRRFAAQRVDLYPHHLAVGSWLRDAFPPGTWLATVNAGAIPYESRLPTIDLVGLCDRHIARIEMPAMGSGVAGHEKSDAAYVLDRRPGVILFQPARLSPEPLTPQHMKHRLRWTAELDLFHEPRFEREYRLRSVDLGWAYFNYYERIASDEGASGSAPREGALQEGALRQEALREG